MTLDSHYQKQLRFGMPSLIEFPLLEENMTLCRELGLDFVELNMNLPQAQLEELGKRDLPDDMDFSLRLYIENTGIYDAEFIRRALEIILSYDCFGLTWDVGHDYACGWKDSDYLMPVRERIGHMHLHDGLPEGNHLPLGTGEIDIPRVMKSVPALSTCVIETKTKEGLVRSVEYMRNQGLF